MEDKDFNVEKNVKDLEYNKILNMITTYIVILATIDISVALAESLDLSARALIVVITSVVLLYKIVKLHQELDNKLREIKELKGK